ncbi:hypothetical protein QAD02_007249 [Eretmocerus hayati]|uniref:Uncharacterized protein n=1 Tax=Eretmocerus hayati TaxID=131215 RepID=A0ACC2N3G5_9HYME|nr:hypothetical protein QAD02_007249 [Eretmocerus hayati]
MKPYPCPTMRLRCNGCNRDDACDKITFPIHEDIIKAGYGGLEEELDTLLGGKMNLCMQCKKMSLQESFTTGPYICLNTDEVYSDDPVLGTDVGSIPSALQLRGERYMLGGLVAHDYQNDQHYTAYCRDINGNWKIRNDTKPHSHTMGREHRSVRSFPTYDMRWKFHDKIWLLALRLKESYHNRDLVNALQKLNNSRFVTGFDTGEQPISGASSSLLKKRDSFGGGFIVTVDDNDTDSSTTTPDKGVENFFTGRVQYADDTDESQIFLVSVKLGGVSKIHVIRLHCVVRGGESRATRSITACTILTSEIEDTDLQGRGEQELL